MSNENELLILRKTAVSVPTDVDKLISDVKANALTIVGDVTTAKGRKEIVSTAFRITKTKTAIGNLITDTIKAKEAEIAPVLELIAQFRAKKKLVDGELSALADKARASVTGWEQAEAERVKNILDRIEIIRFRGETHGSSKELTKAHSAVLLIEIDDSFAEFKEKASLIKDEVLGKLFVKINQQIGLKNCVQR